MRRSFLAEIADKFNACRYFPTMLCVPRKVTNAPIVNCSGTVVP